MATTRLIYPPTMQWTEEDERKFAHILSDNPQPVEVAPYVVDETPVEAMPRHVVDLGVNSQGVRTRLHFQDNEIITERLWDAEPYLKAAAAKRRANEGRKLSEGPESYGIMPAAILGQAMAEGWIDDADKVDDWFRDNPDFITNQRMLKRTR